MNYKLIKLNLGCFVRTFSLNRPTHEYPSWLKTHHAHLMVNRSLILKRRSVTLTPVATNYVVHVLFMNNMLNGNLNKLTLKPRTQQEKTGYLVTDEKHILSPSPPKNKYSVLFNFKITAHNSCFAFTSSNSLSII